MPETPATGRICLFGFHFVPPGWAACDGSLVSISEYTPLFALIGTTYGGDGVSTFGLPDLRGRVPLGAGQGAGLSPYGLGQSGGSESVSLLSSEIPAHTHLIGCDNGGGSAVSPEANILAPDPGANTAPFSGGTADGTLNASALGSAGQNQPHENRQPYLVLNYCIALMGNYPMPN
jgi:microcystin-dependent protein